MITTDVATPSEPFASAFDLEARWRTLTDAEKASATILIEDAEDLIKVTCPRWAAATDVTRRRVTCAMVRRAMQGGEVGDGDTGSGVYADPRGIVASESHTTGPFADSFTYSNPEGGLFLRAVEKKALGGTGGAAFEVDLLAGAPVMTETDWLAGVSSTVTGAG